MTKIGNNGLLDVSFETQATLDGFVAYDPIAPQLDGGLIASAYGNFYVQRILRWHANGEPDGTFQPIIPERIPGFAYHSVADARTLDDGRMLIALHYTSGSRGVPDTVRVGRFLPNGMPDTTFAFGGLVRVDGLPRHLQALSPTSSGGVLVFSDAVTADHFTPQVAAILPNGSFDPAFAANGKSQLGFDAESIGFAVSERSITTGANIPANLGSPNRQTAYISHSRRPLKPGAGLMLQWNGDAWPTRFGSDPGPECPYDTPYWDDQDMARGITTVTGKGGYVLDGWGGVHRFSIGLQHPKPAATKGGPY